MAEKEERILIFNVGDQCAYRSEASVSYFAQNGDKIGTRQELVCHREDNWGANCDDKWCEKCDKKDLVGITRQEAIKKISSHLLMCDISTMDTDEIAEAALNALLEGK